MTNTHRHSAARPSFTLVELLVVIAIIVILIALLAGAVMAVRARIPATTTRNDIAQISLALDDFKAKYGGAYPPSRIVLYENLSSYTTMPDTYGLNAASIAFIRRVWPNIDDTQPMKWGGPTVTLAPTGELLEGDQVFVFFLGGIPNGPGLPPGGFSNDPMNPTSTVGDRKKSMTFDGGRIIVRTGNFPSFVDGYGKIPYVYFGSTSKAYRENGYDPTPNSLGVSPYIQKIGPPTIYYNPSRFQILSAGANFTFGPGGPWPPSSNPAAALDDFANFNGDAPLGSPQ